MARVPGFGRRIPISTLSMVCRSLSAMLGSGVEIRKALKTVSKKTGNARCEQAMRGVLDAVDRGEDLTTGMEEQGDAFPPLMIDMVNVAEQTGALPEVLKSLAKHYENLVRLRKNFFQQIAWPAFQLIMAILVIGLLIYILGWIAETRGGEPMQVVPGGLSGTAGAITWFAVNFGVLFGLFFLFQWTRHSLSGQQFLDSYLLRIPILGHCLRCFAIARFSWAFALTQQSGMSIGPSLERSFHATSNGAFIKAYPPVWQMMQDGQSMEEALRTVNLFPEEYLQMVNSAEVSGTVPEMLDHLSPQFEEDANRSLKTLCGGLAWCVWLVVAMFVIFLIFSVFSVYLGALTNAGKPI